MINERETVAAGRDGVAVHASPSGGGTDGPPPTSSKVASVRRGSPVARYALAVGVEQRCATRPPLSEDLGKTGERGPVVGADRTEDGGRDA
ncbi:hypothetical protein SALBM311S_04822 [Streptomyces alboniger]